MDQDCSLSMLAGPADRKIVRMMLNHARKASNFQFSEIVLVIDTLPSPRFPQGAAETKALKQTATDMLSDGEVNRIILTSESAGDIEPAHYGRHLLRKRDFRGIPLLGWILAFEASDSEFMCHFDSDILMYSDPSYSWVADAIAHIRSDANIMFVAPHAGPPSGDSNTTRSKTVSSRRFVIDRSRFRKLLPLRPHHSSWKRHLLMKFGGPSSYWPWEFQVQKAVDQSPYSNIWLGDNRAWFIHSPDHSEIWHTHLPDIVSACRRGCFPPGQRGNHELDLPKWQNWLAGGQFGGLTTP